MSERLLNITESLKATSMKGGLVAEGPILWHMLTVDEIKSLYDFAIENQKQSNDHRVIVTIRHNSIGHTMRVLTVEQFFESSGDHARESVIIPEWPEGAKDVTDYDSW